MKCNLRDVEKVLKVTDRSIADELEGEVEVEELGELGGEVHREALEPVVPGQLLLRLNQHRVRRVLNNKGFCDDDHQTLSSVIEQISAGRRYLLHTLKSSWKKENDLYLHR
jgi:hypothetical protein